MSNSEGFCKVPWIVEARFLTSFRSRKCCSKRGRIGPTSSLNGIAFQSLPSIAIKIAYWRHWESILASLGCQKLWFCMGHVHKIGIFTFCVLNPFQNQYLLDFGHRMAPERVQKRLPRTAKSIQESVIFLNHFWYVFREVSWPGWGEAKNRWKTDKNRKRMEKALCAHLGLHLLPHGPQMAVERLV